MGESKRRSQLDPTFGKVRHYQGRKLLPDFGEYLAALVLMKLFVFEYLTKVRWAGIESWAT